MQANGWWDKSTGFALLTIVLWASLAALTSRVTSVSPLVLVGLVLFFCGLGALPLWRQWRARPVTWLVTITTLLLYHLLLFMSFRHAPVLEANLINYLWPLCIILFTPLLLPSHPLQPRHLLAGALGLAGSMLVMVNGQLQLQQAYLPGYLLALSAAIIWGLYSVLARRLPPAPAVVTAAACLPAGILALLLAWAVEGPLPLAQIPRADWWLIVGLALGPMGAAFVTWYLALREGDPRRIGALSYLTPLLSTLLLVGLNGEQLTSRHWLAGALIIGGALLGLGASPAKLNAKPSKQ
ncbi:DMT family transporter [Aeromonas cavernicola]|uniref:EamA family transporter n=1 Tax=Aeromonas cavernicola TaxID=1006623 RepID=A0A2H9U627_9GAMM|nr:DMT family transporter [Aeromonas cavernicola]PJG59506.1 EamA family transporter [Aeromonas cavernicola]